MILNSYVFYEEINCGGDLDELINKRKVFT